MRKSPQSFLPALLLLASLGLSACGLLGTPHAVAPERVEPIEKIGLVAVLGDAFNLTFEGVRPEDNEYSIVLTPEWQLNSLAKNTAMNQLKQAGYRVTWLGDHFKKDEQMLKAAKAKGLDTLVVIAPKAYDNRPHHPEPFGIHWGSHPGDFRPCVYSLFATRVWDVQNQQLIGWSWGFNELLGLPCYRDGYEQAWQHNKPWRKFKAEYSDAELQMLHANTVKSLTTTVEKALEKLNLTPTP